MKRHLIILLVIFSISPSLIWAQPECTPRELPYIETFNGYWNNHQYIYGAQGTDRCWTLWQGVPTGCNQYQVLFWRLDNGFNDALHIMTGYHLCDSDGDGYVDTVGNRFQQTIVSPPLAEAPVKITFKAAIDGGLYWTKFVYLIIGYVGDIDDIGNSFFALDTFAVQRRPDTNDMAPHNGYYWNYDTLIVADTLPTPCHFAFRIDSTLQRRNHINDSSYLLVGAPYGWFNDLAFIDDLTFHPRTHIYTNLYDTICQGEGYSGYGFNVAPSDAALLHLRDSATACTTWHYQLHLYEAAPSTEELNIIISIGDTFYFDSMPLYAEGDYTFNYSTQYGCDSTIIVHITLDSTVITPPYEPQQYSIWFPNAFTPELETNNRFRGYMDFEPVKYELYIYNRWGNLVFRTIDPNAEWDGTYKGHIAPQGSYTYKYEVHLPDGRSREGIGTVTLIR